ncbi:hypothetical protein S83_051197, partial [Arachis hypogaea]
MSGDICSMYSIVGLTIDFDWKMADPVMAHYTGNESAIVWRHQEADPYFGSCESKELLDHLENVLANKPVVVKLGQHIVEVKPQVDKNKGVSKGIVVENLISNMRSE